MLALMREHDAEQTLLEHDAEERRRRGVTFRELAVEYLRWLEDVKGAKPSTLRDHRCVLAEPGTGLPPRPRLLPRSDHGGTRRSSRA